jgi:hypothetical protein
MKDHTLSYLLVLFVYLKLTHQIDWSWWLVTAPVWGMLLFVFGIAFIARLVKK